MQFGMFPLHGPYSNKNMTWIKSYNVNSSINFIKTTTQYRKIIKYAYNNLMYFLKYGIMSDIVF